MRFCSQLANPREDTHFLDSTLARRRSSSSKARPLARSPPTTATGVTVGSATDSGTCSPTERKTVACFLLHLCFFTLSLFFSFNRQWLRTFYLFYPSLALPPPHPLPPSTPQLVRLLPTYLLGDGWIDGWMDGGYWIERKEGVWRRLLVGKHWEVGYWVGR
jgi:hypothetical protein